MTVSSNWSIPPLQYTKWTRRGCTSQCFSDHSLKRHTVTDTACVPKATRFGHVTVRFFNSMLEHLLSLAVQGKHSLHMSLQKLCNQVEPQIGPPTVLAYSRLSVFFELLYQAGNVDGSIEFEPYFSRDFIRVVRNSSIERPVLSMEREFVFLYRQACTTYRHELCKSWVDLIVGHGAAN